MSPALSSRLSALGSRWIVLLFIACPVLGEITFEKTQIQVGDKKITVKVADNDEKRAHGLMFVKSMPANDGMLFVFDAPKRATFWMKNTKIPLSAAYINPEGVILEIHKLEPEDTNSVTAGSDQIQYVLETTQGWFERHNVTTGAVVRTELGPLKKSFHY